MEITWHCFKPGPGCRIFSEEVCVNNTDEFATMQQGFDLRQALDEAARCLLCFDPPCSKACPAETDPGTFIRKLRFMNITGAIRTIKQNNIMGGSCGVLCPTSRLCEKECSATAIDRPIRIGELQRFLIEHGRRTGFNPLRRGQSKTSRVAVIGSGPAGLSCAAELAKEGYPVVVFEARSEPGGVLRYGVVPFRYNRDFLEKELDDIRALGVEFKCECRIDDPAGAEKLLTEGFHAVFVGTGLWDAVSLNPGGKDVTGLYSSIDFLSSLRDGRFDEIRECVAGKTVAVIGGGSVAMDCVEAAVRLKARDVYLVYRRSYKQMPAEIEELQSAEKAGVHFMLLNQPIDYVTDDQYRLKGVRLIRTRLGEADETGRRKPEQIQGSIWELASDVVIEAIGNRPESAASSWYPNVTVDQGQLIRIHPDTNETSVPGIFAGGDIVRGPALVVQAVQDGKNAARAIIRYLGE
jgi:NADPH-dependent glutamate synthase beta subunit-like oxidoreductase